MDIGTFYAVTSATCFGLVGLWWTVGKDKPEWFTDEAKKHVAGCAYASFLIPGMMSLAAQTWVESSLVWWVVFVIAAWMGYSYSSKLIKITREVSPNGPFSNCSDCTRFKWRGFYSAA